MILENPDQDLSIVDHNLDEEEMIQLLAEKVQAYLDVNINLLMSYLYRLDVKEDDIKVALSNRGENPGNMILAKLIWERQKKRLETKKSIKINHSFGEEWDW